ncbi:MAG: PfkB family carbohydrate kinase [Pleomorphochaeta sp.]
MNSDLLLVGHISRDIMIDYLGNETRILGGAVIYASAVYSAIGLSVKVVSKLPKSEEALKKELENSKIDWIIKESKDMTSIRNHYFTEDKERREAVLLSKADRFNLYEIIEENSDIYCLAGLFVGEIPDSFIVPLSKKGKVALDAQCILRKSDENGNMLYTDWENKRILIPYLTYLKVDAAEAEILTGYSDTLKAIKQLGDWGVKEVMLTHNTKVMVLADGELYSAPYTNSNNSGRTGRGDTTFAAYLAWRKNHSAKESVEFAATLCSMKMEKPGVFSLSVEDVLKRMNEE